MERIIRLSIGLLSISAYVVFGVDTTLSQKATPTPSSFSPPVGPTIDGIDS
jgi:hypothetical protein